MIVIAYENGDPADIHHLSHDLCKKYWLEWLARLQQYTNKFPECSFSEDVNETGQEMSSSYKFEKASESLQAKSVNSIGVPVASLGKVIKEEDLLEEGEEEEEEEEISSKECFYSLRAWLASVKSPETWKRLWKNVLERIRF